ncbi:beta-lactamase [Hyaloraphidium curvatum]|nr:beta-lactamase [Hyaloraphidium curvatum]
MVHDTSKITKVLEDAVASGIPGIAAGVMKDGQLVFADAKGKRGPERPDDCTVDTVFPIFSMTKAITSIAVAQLIERGLISADQALDTIIPEFKGQKILLGWDGDKPKLGPAPRSPTVTELMNHTSGFAYDFASPDLKKYQEVTGHPSVMTLKRAALLEQPLFWEPGTKWEYGTGIDVLGLIVEKVSGKTLGEYLKENIFEPLGMKDSSFAPNLAELHRIQSCGFRTPDGVVIPFALPVGENPEFEMGGGGLLSTVHDYLAFLQALLNGGELNGKRILKAETVEKLVHQDTLPKGIGKVADMDGSPGFSEAYEFWPGLKKGWTWGFCETKEDSPFGPKAGSLCWSGAANTYMVLDPASKVAAVVMMQFFPANHEAAITAKDAVFKAAYDVLA